MAKMTFRLNLVEDEWTALAVGSDYSAFGIVAASASTILFIGDTQPELDESDTMEISASDTRELALDLPTSMTVWVRSERGDCQVQGYRVPV